MQNQTIAQNVARLVKAGLTVEDAVQTVQLLNGGSVAAEQPSTAQTLKTLANIFANTVGNGDDGDDEPQPERRKRRRKRFSRVVYVLTDAAKNAAKRGAVVPPKVRKAIEAVTASQAETLKAIHAAKRNVTARELETLADQKRKTVESNLYALRHLGLVESVENENDSE